MQDLVTDIGNSRYRLFLKASAVEVRPRKTWYQGRYYAPGSRHDSLGEEQDHERQEREELRRWKRKRNGR